jgi:hypothetical protein
LKNLPPPSDTRLGLRDSTCLRALENMPHVMVTSSASCKISFPSSYFQPRAFCSVEYHSCTRDPTQNILSCYLLLAVCLAGVGDVLHSKLLLKALMNGDDQVRSIKRDLQIPIDKRAHVASKVSNSALSSSRISSKLSLKFLTGTNGTISVQYDSRAWLPYGDCSGNSAAILPSPCRYLSS